MDYLKSFKFFLELFLPIIFNLEFNFIGKHCIERLKKYLNLWDAISALLFEEIAATEKEVRQRIDFHVDVQHAYTYTSHKDFRQFDIADM